jgi:hypothetical protein
MKVFTAAAGAASDKLQQAQALPLHGLASPTGRGLPVGSCLGTLPPKGAWTHPLHGLAPPPPNMKDPLRVKHRCGHATGHATGHSTGHATGHAAGHATGNATGHVRTGTQCDWYQ